MVSTKYANSIAELLEYLKGIEQQDIDKIPKTLMQFFQENASKDYEVMFDNCKPLSELQYELSDDTLGLISMICYNYWCETEEEKRAFLNQLRENEEVYQEELKKKYEINFSKDKKDDNTFERDNNLQVLVEIKKENFFIKLFKTLLSKFK